MVVDYKNNEIGKEINIGEIESNLVNNVILKPKEFSESSRRNTHSMRCRYVPARRTITFPLDSFQEKLHLLKKLALPQ